LVPKNPVSHLHNESDSRGLPNSVVPARLPCVWRLIEAA